LEEPPETPTIDITGDPADRITEKEYKFLEELKKDEVSKYFSDKLLMIFAFARKMDVKRTVELLRANHKWVTENNYSYTERIPDSAINPKLLESKYTFCIPNCKDKLGRGVTYLFPGRIIFKNFTMKEHLDYLMYQCQIMMLDNGLDIHRAGFVYVEEIKGVKLANFDMKTSKTMNNELQNNFPNRVKAIYVMNGGVILRALLAIAKLLVKAKIIARVSSVTTPELHNFIDKSQLITEFGGDLVSGIDWNTNKSKK